MDICRHIRNKDNKNFTLCGKLINSAKNKLCLSYYSDKPNCNECIIKFEQIKNKLKINLQNKINNNQFLNLQESSWVLKSSPRILKKLVENKLLNCTNRKSRLIFKYEDLLNFKDKFHNDFVGKSLFYISFNNKRIKVSKKLKHLNPLDLGKDTDKKIAAKYNVSKSEIHLIRNKFGIPCFDLKKSKIALGR